MPKFKAGDRCIGVLSKRVGVITSIHESGTFVFGYYVNNDSPLFGPERDFDPYVPEPTPKNEEPLDKQKVRFIRR